MQQTASELAALGRELHSRGWLPATSGNLSVRVGTERVLITASGLDKGRLTPADFLEVDLDARPVGSPLRPSAEARIHAGLYRSDPSTGAVLHVHSPYASVVSRSMRTLVFDGWELQKAFVGVESLEQALPVHVFANEPDIGRIAAAVVDVQHRVPGFLLAGHGPYAWGATLSDALRHLEALEELCHLTWLSR